MERRVNVISKDLRRWYFRSGVRKFIYSYRWAREFGRGLYFCNRRMEWFYLGHCIPDGCCELVKEVGSSPLQEVLLRQILDLNEEMDGIKKMAHMLRVENKNNALMLNRIDDSSKQDY